MGKFIENYVNNTFAAAFFDLMGKKMKLITIGREIQIWHLQIIQVSRCFVLIKFYYNSLPFRSSTVFLFIYFWIADPFNWSSQSTSQLSTNKVFHFLISCWYISDILYRSTASLLRHIFLLSFPSIRWFLLLIYGPCWTQIVIRPLYETWNSIHEMIFFFFGKKTPTLLKFWEMVIKTLKFSIRDTKTLFYRNTFWLYKQKNWP